MGVFNDPVKASLLKTLDAAALRQKVIADNIANADTPGFKKTVVHFEDALAQALGGHSLPLKTTDPRHIGANLAGAQPRTERVTTTSLRTDGNNVDVEEEMMNMVTNTITYRSATQFLSGKYAKLRYVISGGR
ncbi:MAG: flagellar basal body rod protein FlgB [Ammonifex sp.]|jgi:flagellar basal-body rod protein FlgB|nr:MAG: flagellar basal body rod protein FlgB [Ammonifex sp.]